MGGRVYKEKSANASIIAIYELVPYWDLGDGERRQKWWGGGGWVGRKLEGTERERRERSQALGREINNSDLAVCRMFVTGC